MLSKIPVNVEMTYVQFKENVVSQRLFTEQKSSNWIMMLLILILDAQSKNSENVLISTNRVLIIINIGMQQA